MPYSLEKEAFKGPEWNNLTHALSQASFTLCASNLITSQAAQKVLLSKLWHRSLDCRQWPTDEPSSQLASKHTEINNSCKTPWGFQWVAARTWKDVDLSQTFQGRTAELELVLLQQAALAVKGRGTYSWIQLKDEAATNTLQPMGSSNSHDTEVNCPAHARHL